ncbi:MAG TPA: Uma2 family endonuclease [Thermoanaerobaculia bacterium]|nr:Uma2 family endonuclease [Thermoanaerobaculia bacterium]
MVAEEVGHRWTRAEYERAVDLGVFEGWRIELVNGILYDLPAQSPGHAGSMNKALRELREVSSGQGLDLRPRMPLAISVDSLPEPDIAVIPEDPKGDFYAAAHPTTAVLVVEIADLSLQYDGEVKSRIYARASIPEYWIMNLRSWQLEVYREPTSDTYGSRTILSLSDEVSPLFAAGAVIPVAQLFPQRRS